MNSAADWYADAEQRERVQKSRKMPEKIKLKPCPFCGGKEIRQGCYFDHDEFVHFVYCHDCGARTKPTYRSRGSGAAVRMFFEEKAAEAWNRRTE